MSSALPALEARAVTKRFGGRAVLRDADLTVNSGEVHALVGANGSGKSTFVKVVAGFHVASEYDKLEVRGVAFPDNLTAATVAKLGVRVVHQDLGLVPELSILENVALATGFSQRKGLIRWRRSEQLCREALERVELDRDPQTLVDQLAVWERVAVAFARAVYDGLDAVSLLILDEITAALPRDQVINVLNVVRRMKTLGAGVLYVTHRFEEIFEVADHITVLVDGRVEASKPISEFTPAGLVDLVAGHDLVEEEHVPPPTFGEPRLIADGICSERLHDVSLKVHAGEIVGVIGRAGCGRSTLGRMIFGLEAFDEGRLVLNGNEFTKLSVPRAMSNGVAYVPQDRLGSGLLPAGTVKENATLIDLPDVSRYSFISRARERERATHLVESYDVRPADVDMFMTQLSGGNQQKVLVSRWMSKDRTVLVLDEPTEGVDAGARAIIYDLIDRTRRDGAAVLVLTSSIEEALELCDRIVLMSSGQIVREFTGEQISPHVIEEALLMGETRVGETA
jgi:ABC-type sugar transport system ATPase subunit